MLSFKHSYYLFIVLIMFCGCGFAEREKQIANKEKQLLQKEQELNMRDQQLKLKEMQLGQQATRLDSTLKQWDSVGVYNPALTGEWTVKMSCSETSCEGSAIGDTKTERWDIFYENNQVKVNAYSGKNLARIYTGLYKDGALQLKAAENSETADIQVDLHPVADKDNKMTGTRLITQSSCKIIYDLVADKKLATKK